MNKQKKIIISASRRTDIPAFYMDWFMSCINRGYFKVENPYNNKQSIFPASTKEIHTIVFWSKNYDYFIKTRSGEKLIDKGYNLFFHFTINSNQKILEPFVPLLDQKLKQLEYLSKNFFIDSIRWRFDPICFFKNDSSNICNNLSDFKIIANYASNLGIKNCITSFMNNYKKIKKRVKSYNNFEFFFPDNEKKIEILLSMEKILNNYNINLFTCCEKDLIENIPIDSKIKPNSCIDNNLFINLFGEKLSLKKDTGQRAHDGCNCMISKDIGSYKKQPCQHKCLYCYASIN